MSITRASAMTFEALILIVIIWKLKRAKVSRTDSGHLNMCDASLLVLLQAAEAIICVFSALYFNFNKTMISDKMIAIMKDVADYLLAIMYFKMIQRFVTQFKL